MWKLFEAELCLEQRHERRQVARRHDQIEVKADHRIDVRVDALAADDAPGDVVRFEQGKETLEQV